MLCDPMPSLRPRLRAALLATALTACTHAATIKPCPDLGAVAGPVGPVAAAKAEPHPDLEAALPNFRVIEPGAVYRGGRPPAGGVDALAKAGVRTIVDLQGGDLDNGSLRHLVVRLEPGEAAEAIAAEEQAATAGGMHFASRPINSLRRLTPEEVTTIMGVLALMHDPAAQPVYLHCEHGKDRTGIVSALYRVRYNGWTPAAAHDEMVAAGHSGLLDHLATGSLDEDLWEIAAVMAAARAEAR
jgi:protein tyrosine/serine phosphatase